MIKSSIDGIRPVSNIKEIRQKERSKIKAKMSRTFDEDLEFNTGGAVQMFNKSNSKSDKTKEGLQKFMKSF